jgi:hypothetical protein
MALDTVEVFGQLTKITPALDDKVMLGDTSAGGLLAYTTVADFNNLASSQVAVTPLVVKYDVAGYVLSGIADNTWFDIITFDTINNLSVTNLGGFIGELDVVFINDDTAAGSYTLGLNTQRFIIGLNAGVLSLSQAAAVGSVPAGGTPSIQEKAAATAKNLVLQYKATHPNWGDSGKIAWRLIGLSVADSANTLIVPSSAGSVQTTTSTTTTSTTTTA